MSEAEGGSQGMNVEDLETGEPVRELLNLEYDTSPVFLTGVRRKIHRRVATAHVASFSWNLPKAILLELIRLLGHSFGALGDTKGTRK